MSFFGWFGRKETPSAAADTHSVKANYDDLIQKLKKLSPDWSVNRIGIDAEVYRNHWELRAYSRSLWRENPYIIGYGQDLCANVIGPKGYTYRMVIKEEEDRVVHSPQERAALRAMDNRRTAVAAYVTAKTGRKTAFRKLYRETKGVAKVEVGSLDIFANQLIERKFKEWQKKENCTVTGRLTYNESRQLRLKACARDGEHFIRLVRDSKFKPFGFKLQHINAEWCNYYFTGKCKETGNPVRFGIEYDDSGPAPVPVAYHFIAGTASDWMSFAPRPFMSTDGSGCVRIEAKDVIHYGKFDDDADVTRPVPWTTPVMSNARQTAKWIEAAVISARAGACSGVFFEADLAGPDGTTVGAVDADQMKKLVLEMNPGGMHGLPPGVRAKEFNPNNPNATTGAFRNELLREMCAGLPAAQFSTIGQNYAEINFSAGRLERLSITAQWMMLQEWDIATEHRIFSEWLEMALVTQAVPLPLRKLAKFDAVQITGRRWEGVDPIKEATAKAMNLANKFTSLQRIHDEQGTDLETTLFEIMEANMMMEQFGIDTATTAGPVQPPKEPEEPKGDDKSEP
jgi:lambda family phage portal protein